MADFSEYIVFVDESGDHGLATIDPQFPVFTLAFCIFDKLIYTDTIVPAFHRFKMKYWGHDSIVLHEHEIRQQSGAFGFLRTNKNLREEFLNGLNNLVSDIPFDIYAVTIHKNILQDRYKNPWNPYQIALHLCMEYTLSYLLSKHQNGKTLHIQFEGRGKKEDKELELEFRRICDNQSTWGWKDKNFMLIDFQSMFLPKRSNAVGLQIADLIARPIALHALRPFQPNRAFDIIRPKLRYHKEFPR